MNGRGGPAAPARLAGRVVAARAAAILPLPHIGAVRVELVAPAGVLLVDTVDRVLRPAIELDSLNRHGESVGTCEVAVGCAIEVDDDHSTLRLTTGDRGVGASCGGAGTGLVILHAVD